MREKGKKNTQDPGRRYSYCYLRKISSSITRQDTQKIQMPWKETILGNTEQKKEMINVLNRNTYH